MVRIKRAKLREIADQLAQCCSCARGPQAPDEKTPFRIFNSSSTGVLYASSKRLGIAALPDLCNLPARQRENFTIEDVFEMGGVIGTGSSGSVRRGRLKGKVFAIKDISKKSSLWLGSRARREATTLREITILAETADRKVTGVAQTYAALETEGHIYVVMEYCTGGDLMTAVEDEQEFTEQRTAHIIRSLVSTLSELHSVGIVHRDLKLENVVFIDESEGSAVKLVDFGLSNTLNRKMLTSFVGTGCFMAPEVLRPTKDKKREYGEKVDMWGVGLIMYMLLSATLPFPPVADHNALAELIDEVGIDFPEAEWSDISEGAMRLIMQLVCTDVDARLSAKEMMNNKWLQSNADSYCPRQPSPRSPRTLRKESAAEWPPPKSPSLVERVVNACFPRKAVDMGLSADLYEDELSQDGSRDGSQDGTIFESESKDSTIEVSTGSEDVFETEDSGRRSTLSKFRNRLSGDAMILCSGSQDPDEDMENLSSMAPGTALTFSEDARASKLRPLER